MKRVGMRFIGRRAVGKYMAATIGEGLSIEPFEASETDDRELSRDRKKIDAQSSQVSWLNNVNVAAMLQEGDGDNGGMLFYLTTDSNWNR